VDAVVIRRALLLPLLAIALFAMGATRALLAEDHEASDEIRIGISAALSGPNKSLGQSMRRGIEACFARVNADGGVHGRQLRLVALDDGYVPEVAESNMRRLVDDEKVLAVVGNVGTPTAEKTLPIALDRKVLLLGAFTGADLLRRTPPDRYVINFRASYADETAAMVEGLLAAGIRPDEMAFFTQSDAFGDSGYRGAVRALENAGFRYADRLAHGRYERNTLDVERGLLRILEAEIPPKAVLMVGAYAPCAKLIRIARRALPHTYFVHVSFVSAAELAEELDGKLDRVLFTSVVPHPESDVPLCADYRRDLAAAHLGVRHGFVSLEGYLVARILVRGLRAAGPDVTRESLIDGIEREGGFPASALGTPVELGPGDHEGCERVWPVRMVDGAFEPFDWATLLDEPDEPSAPPPAADEND
jgi:ABC-type branched-subunit amino acid transport system substrate-binding protein